MPKKDTHAAVLGMLSSAGAQTRASDVAERSAPVAADPASIHAEPATDTRPSATVSPLPPSPRPTGVPEGPAAPRTVRLRTETARQLREAWLLAKRDDVLLQYQDFATMIIDEALASRRRGARTTASS